MTASSLGCVIGCCVIGLLCDRLMWRSLVGRWPDEARGVLVVAEEPMDRRWLPIRRLSIRGS
jgi:hypothetical protein